MKSKGQMLIEVVVSIGILALVLIGVSDLMTRSQRQSEFQTKKDDAMEVAKSLLNDYRSQKEMDPVTFLDNVAGINRAVCIEGKDFSCVVEVTKGSSSVDLNITVSWVDGSNTLSINLKNTINI